MGYQVFFSMSRCFVSCIIYHVSRLRLVTPSKVVEGDLGACDNVAGERDDDDNDKMMIMLWCYL